LKLGEAMHEVVELLDLPGRYSLADQMLVVPLRQEFVNFNISLLKLCDLLVLANEGDRLQTPLEPQVKIFLLSSLIVL